MLAAVAASGRGRPRRWLAVVVAAALVLVLGYAWLAEPLVTGHAGMAAGPAGTTGVPDGQGGVSYPYVAGARVAYGVEVRDSLLLPVTITGLDPDVTANDGLIQGSTLFLLRDASVIDSQEAALRPFAPVTLGPGESVFMMVVGTEADCRWATDHFSPGTGVTYVQLRLSAQVLGLGRSVDVPLMSGLELLAPETRTCPA